MAYSSIAPSQMASDAPLSTTLLNQLNDNINAMVRTTLLNHDAWGNNYAWVGGESPYLACSPGQVDRTWTPLSTSFVAKETYRIVVPPHVTKVKVTVHIKSNSTGTVLRVSVGGVNASADQNLSTSFVWRIFEIDAPGVGAVDLVLWLKGDTAHVPVIREVIAYIEGF